MFRRRLRDMPSQEELAKIYVTPHDHSKFGFGHHLRVQHTITLGTWMVKDFGLTSGADLSCGNGIILTSLPLSGTKVYGDFAPGFQIAGPIEETIEQIHPVDLFICSETIEHLDDPDTVLKQIRNKSNYLLLSTPIGENDLGNPEHLWGWDQETIEAMITDNGWETIAHVDLFTPNHGYNYQIWSCK